MVQVLFIHGVNGHGSKAAWVDALNQGLRFAGRPELSVDPIAPDYTHLLKDDPPADFKAPANTFIKAEPAGRDQAHFRYALEVARYQRIAEAWPSPSRGPIQPPDLAVNAGMQAVGQATTYANKEGRRGKVLEKVLKSVSADGDDLVIISHSLGSVVALDLLYLLPKSLRVRLLLTAGSPLAIDPMARHLRRLNDSFPYERVDAWVNIADPLDVVAHGQGISYKFPEALDVFVSTQLKNPHKATGYLEQGVVGDVVGQALFGSKSTELAVRTTSPDVPLSEGELARLLGVQYALQAELAIDDKGRRARFEAARLAALDEARELVELTKQAAPDRLMNSVWDSIDGDLGAELRGRFDPLTALTLLVLFATSSPLEPFEFHLEDAEKRRALRNLLSDLGLDKNWADRVLEAVDAAFDAHQTTSTWLKVAGGSAIAVGALAVVAAPFLIVPFAAAGTAGAAAITSGLAGLGALSSGGMVAGIVTITSMAAGGAAAAALGAAAVHGAMSDDMEATKFAATARMVAHSTPEQLLPVVVQQQALALLRHGQGVEHGTYAEWFLLTSIQALVAEELARHQAYSDKKSSALKAWSDKKKIVDRAVEWMRSQKLGPLELGAAETEIEDARRNAASDVARKVRRRFTS